MKISQWISVVIFVGLFNTVFACDDLNYLNDVAQENVKALDSCIVSVQKVGVESVKCEVASKLPSIVWEKVNATDCQLSKEQKTNLLSMDYALEAYNVVLAEVIVD